jgi:UDP-GlcNAc:undecaprenyl-phosphate GlcNAc-1-phosphate transferase
MPNKYKVLVQVIVACIIVFYGGLKLTRTTFLGLAINFDAIPLLPEVLSILIIVAIINAMNLIDGLDGLCAGISSIYFLTIAILGFVLNKFGGLDVILSLIMLGCTLGYLVHNFPPAKIYQGDAGSTFCGVMIAVICLIGFKTTTLASLIVPVFILAIPILDTLFAIIRRKLKGQKIDQADKEHIHHQLLKKFSKKSSLLIIYAINVLFSITTIFYTIGDKKLSIICYILLAAIVLFLILKTNVIFDRKNK